MANPRENSSRQKIINMVVGSTLRFPVERHKSIRAMVYDIKRAYKGYEFTTCTTPSFVKVTCIARPEMQNN